MQENATYDGQDIVQSNLHLIARARGQGRSFRFCTAPSDVENKLWGDMSIVKTFPDLLNIHLIT